MKQLLWTIQHRTTYDEFERTEILRANGKHLAFDGEFRFHYDWLVAQMRKRIGKPPVGVQYPVWAWYQWEGQRKRRDMRCSGHAPRGTPIVQIAFEAEEKDILLSDFDTWNIAMSNQYIADNEQDWNQFYASKRKDQKDAVVASWEKVFDLNRYTPDWDAPLDRRSIQATMWEIRIDQVKQVEFFLAK